jgi:hypothetical protein
MADRSCRIDDSAVELIALPPISLEALLELRRLLDSIQSAETGCERTPLLQVAAPTQATAPVASAARARRQSPLTEEAEDEFPSFQ